MNSNILVTIKKSNDFFDISTSSHQHADPGHFLVKTDKVLNAMHDESCRCFIDTYQGNYLKYNYNPRTKMHNFEIVWLVYGVCDTVDGFVQRFSVSRKAFRGAFHDPNSQPYKYLHTEKYARRCT